jgi:putative MATE family efflux protein
MTKNDNTTMFQTIMTLALPTMLEQLMQTTVQYIDTAMVGTLGTAATAAVGSTTTVTWLVNGTVMALSIGFLAFISQSLGANNRDLARRAAGQATLSVLVIGTLFTLLTLGLSKYIPVWMQVKEEIRQTASIYFFILFAPMLFRTATIIFGTVLRAAGDTQTPMKVGILVNIVNVVLNFLMIFPTRTAFRGRITIPGFGWGVVGAAVASAIAFVVGGIVITMILWRHPLISPKGQKLTPDMQILKPCLRVAFPNMLQR